MLLADGTSEELVAEFRALTERQLVIIRTLSMRLKGAGVGGTPLGRGKCRDGLSDAKTGIEEVEPNE